MDDALRTEATRLLAERRFDELEALTTQAEPGDRPAWALWGTARIGRADLGDDPQRLPHLDSDSPPFDAPDVVRAKRAASSFEHLGQSLAASILRRALLESIASIHGAGSDEAIEALAAYLWTVFQQDLGRFDQLARGYELLSSWQKEAGSAAPNLAETLFLLSQSRAGAGASLNEAAAPLIEASTLIAEDDPSPVGPSIWVALADVIEAKGDTIESSLLLRRAETVLKQREREHRGESSFWSAMAAIGLGDRYLRRQQHAESRPYYTLATALVAAPVDHEAAKQLALAHRRLGVVDNQLGDAASAREALEKAVEVVDAQLGPLHLEVAYAHADLGLFLWSQSDPAAAIPHLSHAVTMAEKLFPNSPLPPPLQPCQNALHQARSQRAILREAEDEWQSQRLALLATTAGDGPLPKDLPLTGVAPPLQFRAARAAAAAERFAEALDRLLEVLTHGGPDLRRRARELVSAVFRRCGTKDPEVNERRRRLAVYL